MTKKMPRLFAENPPREPITSLETLVNDWNYRFGKNGISKHMRDEVVDMCAKAKNMERAVKLACASKRPNGKMHNHQSRVPRQVRDTFATAILDNARRGGRGERADIRNCKTFDALYDLLADLAPDGIGPVTLYDVATRIAAFMQLEVRSLYLHAGVKLGWCLLHGQTAPTYDLRVPREELPKPLRKLPTDEVEDLLCAYREVLQPWCAHG